MSWFWILWMVFLFTCVIPPVGYGWGRLGWGPPYPRYIQRRRAQAAAPAIGAAPYNHHAWGWRGDAIWVLVAVWAMITIFWGFTSWGGYWWR